MSVQETLDGSEADLSTDRGGLTVGSGVILDEADPGTDWKRVCRWIVRAREEGVLR